MVLAFMKRNKIENFISAFEKLSQAIKVYKKILITIFIRMY